MPKPLSVIILIVYIPDSKCRKSKLIAGRDKK
jgi:hypothetical protein